MQFRIYAERRDGATRALAAGSAQNARPGETRSGSIAEGDNIAARRRRARPGLGRLWVKSAEEIASEKVRMDHDQLCASARIARISGNIDHELERSTKIAIALILNRPEWLEEFGVSFGQAMKVLGEHNVRIVAGAKRTLLAELS